MKELLIDMVKKFCKDNNEPTTKDLQEMDGKIFMVNIMYHCIGGKYLFDAHEGINKIRPATLSDNSTYQ